MDLLQRPQAAKVTLHLCVDFQDEWLESEESLVDIVVASSLWQANAKANVFTGYQGGMTAQPLGGVSGEVAFWLFYFDYIQILARSRLHALDESKKMIKHDKHA